MIALAALALFALPAAAPEPVTVTVLRAHLHEWNGRQVAVRGWLHGCGASIPNLSGRCYLTPSSSWRQGRDRLKLIAFPRMADTDHEPVVVRGTVEEAQCAPDTICLDGESDLRVDVVDTATPLTVPDVQRRQVDLVGRRVQLRGWLVRECVHLECALYARRSRDAVARVSIGAAPAFDDAVRAAVGREIVVEATVTSHCWPSSGFRCTDRGDQLADPRLLRILP